MSEIMLKPCPFCGSKAHFEKLLFRPEEPGKRTTRMGEK